MMTGFASFFRANGTRAFAAVLLVVFSASGCSSSAFRATSFPSRSPAETEFPPKVAAFKTELERRIAEVPEFAAIREWAKQAKVPVWAAGGTAAGFAHQVKHQLEWEWRARTGRAQRIPKTRLGWNYYDIYRTTQDADIVIDGTEADAKALEAFLQSRFSYLQGAKSVWEVRLLRSSRGSGAGEKEPLLDNPNFTEQNSDSHSTGMVEISDYRSHSHASNVVDLYDPKNAEDPRFLRDVLEGELTFYLRAGHSGTKRFQAGLNPEILSVIRYYTKAFQYGLGLRAEDEASVREIVAKFDASDPRLSQQSLRYVRANASKLFLHAQDVEFAWNELERIGLRRKLETAAIRNGWNELALAMKREPLRSYPIGEGPLRGPFGRTAGEIGIVDVAHETRDFRAYENIIMSKYGKPNVFISRNGAIGETAVHGDGFYTKVGNTGARGTGFTIRYKVDPQAREGRDFFLANGGEFVVFRNANALITVDETFNLSKIDLVRLVYEQGDLSGANRGFLEKLFFRLRTRSAELSVEEQTEAARLLRNSIGASAKMSDSPLLPIMLKLDMVPSADAERYFLSPSSVRQMEGLQAPLFRKAFAGRPDSEYLQAVEAYLRRVDRRLGVMELMGNWILEDEDVPRLRRALLGVSEAERGRIVGSLERFANGFLQNGGSSLVQVVPDSILAILSDRALRPLAHWNALFSGAELPEFFVHADGSVKLMRELAAEPGFSARRNFVRLLIDQPSPSLYRPRKVLDGEPRWLDLLGDLLRDRRSLLYEDGKLLPELAEYFSLSQHKASRRSAFWIPFYTAVVGGGDEHLALRRRMTMNVAKLLAETGNWTPALTKELNDAYFHVDGPHRAPLGDLLAGSSELFVAANRDDPRALREILTDFFSIDEARRAFSVGKDGFDGAYFWLEKSKASRLLFFDETRTREFSAPMREFLDKERARFFGDAERAIGRMSATEAYRVIGRFQSLRVPSPEIRRLTRRFFLIHGDSSIRFPAWKRARRLNENPARLYADWFREEVAEYLKPRGFTVVSWTGDALSGSVGDGKGIVEIAEHRLWLKQMGWESDFREGETREAKAFGKKSIAKFSPTRGPSPLEACVRWLRRRAI